MTNSSFDAALSAELLSSATTSAGRTVPHIEETVRLFASLRTPLLRYGLTFGIDVSDAEEIVQEAFLALFRHLEAGKSGSNLRGWIFRVYHNLALKHRARMGTAQEISSSDVTWLGRHADEAPNPEERYLQAQRQRKLQSVFRALPEQDRCCVSLRAEGFRYREIAEILGMSLGAVSTSLTRSLAKFERADKE
jgi:RNA polymerase sigma-70 factor, ECF subfamily